MRQRVMTSATVLLVMMVAFAGAAVASEVVEEVDGEGDEATVSVSEVEATWDDEAGAVVIAVGVAGDGTRPCDGVTVSRVDGELVILVDDVALAADAELPVGCHVYDGTGDDGKVNHGTMVSAVARNLSPHDLDVPKGWIMREVAKEKPTRVKAGDDNLDGDDDGDLDGDDGEKKDKPAKDKTKKDKPAKNDKAKNDKAKNDKAKNDKAKNDKVPSHARGRNK